MATSNLRRLAIMNIVRGSIFLIFISTSAVGQTEVLTNDDIILLKKAGISDEVVIKKIQHSDLNFNVSNKEIINLKKQGVSNGVLEAMIIGRSGRSEKINSDSVTSEKNRGVQNLNYDFCLDVNKSIVTANSNGRSFKLDFKKGRKESTSSGTGRALASVITLGIVKMYKEYHYAILPGYSSDVKISGWSPVFNGLYTESGQSPDDAIKLVRFEAGGNSVEGRALPIGEGAISYYGSRQGTLTHSPHESYTIKLNYEKVAENCVVNSRQVTVWRAKPAQDLSIGEYAILLEPDRYYDFAIAHSGDGLEKDLGPVKQ